MSTCADKPKPIDELFEDLIEQLDENDGREITLKVLSDDTVVVEDDKDQDED